MSDTDNTETDSVRFKFLALSCYGDFFRRPKQEIRYVKIFNSKNVWISLHFPCYSAPSPISVIVIVTQKKCNKDRHKQVWPSRPISCPRTKRFFCKVSLLWQFLWDSNCIIEEISSRLLKRSNRQKFTARSSCHPPLNHLVWQLQFQQQHQKRLIFNRNLECSDKFQFVSWKIQKAVKHVQATWVKRTKSENESLHERGKPKSALIICL